MEGRTVSLVIFVMLALSIPITATAVSNEVVYQEQVTSDFNVRFTTTFYENMSVKISAVNEAEYSRNTSFSVYVGDAMIESANRDLLPGQSDTWMYNLSQVPNPTKSSQRVLFTIHGPNIEYTYNRTTSAEDSDEVLMAEIANVSVEPASDGDGVDLVVRVVDHSPHAYSKLLVVHSKETHRKLGNPHTTQDNVDTVRIPLNEKQGEPVEGELRLYSDYEFRKNATMDMVEFSGRTNGSTSHEPVDFEQFEPGNYRYGMENDAKSRDKFAVISDGNITDVGLALGMLGVSAIALLSMIAVWVRRRLS